jgi:hypothetical protein
VENWVPSRVREFLILCHGYNSEAMFGKSEENMYSILPY